MHAILSIDLKALHTIFLNDLINPGWAIALRRLGPFRQIHVERDIGIRQRKVTGLVLFVSSIRQKY